MTRRRQNTTEPAKAKARARRRTRRVLLVEPTPAHRAALEACGTGDRPVAVVHAPKLEDARRYLARQPVDLVLAARELPDGDGLDLVAELSRVKPATATVLLQPTADF
ncbi:MAG: response regulator, partial [Planctomycetota bacterium]